MPSRFSFGNSTKASARLLALRWVMALLCSISKAEVDPQAAVEAIRQFAEVWGCADDGRGGGGACVSFAVARHVRRRVFPPRHLRGRDIRILPLSFFGRTQPTQRSTKRSPRQRSGLSACPSP